MLKKCRNKHLSGWIMPVLWRGPRAALTVWLCLHSTIDGAHAQPFLEDAQLVDVRLSGLSYTADDMSSGYGNLSDGGIYTFDRYYDSNFGDVRLTMLTPVNPNFGIFWGFGTGERGEKYRIDPSVKVGFLATRRVRDNGILSLSVSAVIGGYLREKSCTADYGAIGGVQSVNCRLADSVLPPRETLKYLLHQRPGDQVSISLRYQLRY